VELLASSAEAEDANPAFQARDPGRSEGLLQVRDITVYTVILGGYDNLRTPRVYEAGVKYVCVTDEPLSCAPWEIRPAWLPYESLSRNSRIPKILAHLQFDSEYTIYHDGHFALNAMPSQLVDHLLADADIAMYRHPCRQSVYEEQQICERECIGAGPEMTAQINRYRDIGLGSGLWAGGFIARRNTEQVVRFNETWWDEYIHGCTRDQIALPAAQLSTGIKINTIDADILMDSKRLVLCMHADWINMGDNGQFVEARQKRQRQTERLRTLCQ
jgi:hypothetical protein